MEFLGGEKNGLLNQYGRIYVVTLVANKSAISKFELISQGIAFKKNILDKSGKFSVFVEAKKFKDFFRFCFKKCQNGIDLVFQVIEGWKVV